MPTRTFIDAIRETLADEMRRDETVIVLGEDVGKKGGVFLATDGLWAEFGDDRVIDTPLTESMIVGASISSVRMPVSRSCERKCGRASCPRSAVSSSSDRYFVCWSSDEWPVRRVTLASMSVGPSPARARATASRAAA